MMRDLLSAKGIKLSKGTVHKYMNSELQLKSITRKPKYKYLKVQEPYKVFDNLIKQDFVAEAHNQKWCIDFTYLRLSTGHKRYNCSIIDLYNRSVVATKNSNKIDHTLAEETVKAAMKSARNPEGVILHSDRGSQFTSKAFVDFCNKNGIKQSMSRAGCPYDNAPMERYFNTLKAEEINLHSYSTDEELNSAIVNYAFGWYNNLRPHSYNGNIPPRKKV